MSLILEALNKAEQTHNTSKSHYVPQTFLPETKTNNKWALFLLVTTACLISATITYLVIQQLSTNDEATHTEAPNSSTPTTDNINQQQPLTQQNTTPVYRQQPARNNTIKQKESRLHNLVKKPVTSNKTKSVIKTHKTNNTPSIQKPKQIIATAPQVTYSKKLDTKNDRIRIEARDINTLNTPPLTEMDISVHMHSETPGKRFIYIDSTRYGEGATIKDGIILDKITKNGIIIDIHGTLYRLLIKQQ